MSNADISSKNMGMNTGAVEGYAVLVPYKTLAVVLIIISGKRLVGDRGKKKIYVSGNIFIANAQRPN